MKLWMLAGALALTGCAQEAPIPVVPEPTAAQYKNHQPEAHGFKKYPDEDAAKKIMFLVYQCLEGQSFYMGKSSQDPANMVALAVISECGDMIKLYTCASTRELDPGTLYGQQKNVEAVLIPTVITMIIKGGADRAARRDIEK